MRRCRRTALSADERVAASAVICHHLSGLVERLEWHAPAVVAVYLATATEPNIDAFAAHLIEHEVTVVAPASGPAPFYSLLAPSQELPRGAWGVREPQPCSGGRYYHAEELSVIVVPGLAFDGTGGRLGHGGGWYDHVLADVPLSVGVCFDYQVIAAVPREPHDQPVTMVVTERRVMEAADGQRAHLNDSSLHHES